MSCIVVSSGATPFMVNRIRPKGGVVGAISRVSIRMTANQTGSKPRLLTIGIKKGSVIIMMAIKSTNIPKNVTIASIPKRIKMGLTGRPVRKTGIV